MILKTILFTKTLKSKVIFTEVKYGSEKNGLWKDKNRSFNSSLKMYFTSCCIVGNIEIHRIGESVYIPFNFLIAWS